MASFINIPPPQRGPSIGERIGSAFGQGLGGAIQEGSSRFLQGKINQMFANQERERLLPIAQKLTRSFNLPDEVAPLIAENPSFLPTLLQTMPRPVSDYGVNENEPKIAPRASASIAPPEAIHSNIAQQNVHPQPRSLSQRATGIPEEGYVPFVKEEMQRQAQQAPYHAQIMAQAAEANKAGAKPFPSVPGEEDEEEITVPEKPKKPSYDKYIQDLKNARTRPQQEEIQRTWDKNNREYRENLVARNKSIAQKSAETTKNQEKINNYYKDAIARNSKMAETAKEDDNAYKTAIRTNEAMKTGPATWDNFARSLPEPWNSFTTQNAQKLEAQTPKFIVAFKDKMGGQLTEAKMNLIAKKTIGIGKDKNVNRLISFVAYFDNKLSELRGQAQDEIIMKNNGDVPKDFGAQLDARMKPYQIQVRNDIDALLANKMPSSELAQEALGSFETLPDAKNYKGRSFKHDVTGERWYSDGETWIKAETK